jgi:NAD(P)H dehydrogenase (quinone)
MGGTTILITGATGTTGSVAIDQLLAKGANVRALVHSEGEHSLKLRARGVEVVQGDLKDFSAVRGAMQNICSAYFVYPLETEILKAVAYFSEAAREAGVSHIVSMSQRTARIDSPSHDAQDHWFAERAFDRSGISVTHLRPTLFMEWLLYPFQLPLIVHRGEIVLPGGKGRHAPIAGYDQGRVIASILFDPAPHAGKTYHLYGPEELNYAGIAAAVSDSIGRVVTYVPETLDEFRKRLKSAGLQSFRIQHLVTVFSEYQQDMLRGTNDAVRTLTGIAPMSVRDFATQHIAQLRPSADR